MPKLPPNLDVNYLSTTCRPPEAIPGTVLMLHGNLATRHVSDAPLLVYTQYSEQELVKQQLLSTTRKAFRVASNLSAL